MWPGREDVGNIGRSEAVHSEILGLIELVAGGLGVGAGWIRRVNRSSMIIALGLAVLGLSHFIKGGWASYLPDAGGAIILLGLGMTLGVLRRSRRGSNSGGSDSGAS